MKESGNDTIVLAVTTHHSLKIVHDLAHHLAQSGWSVHVVASGVTSSATDPYTVHDLKMVRDPALFKDLWALFHWIRLLHRLRPGLVVARDSESGLIGNAGGEDCPSSRSCVPP